MPFKSCPNCGKEAGPRTLICSSCSYDFGAKRATIQNCETFPTYNRPLIRVLVPSGICPIPYDNGDIEAWREAVRAKGLESQKVYTNEALDYWFDTCFNRKLEVKGQGEYEMFKSRTIEYLVKNFDISFADANKMFAGDDYTELLMDYQKANDVQGAAEFVAEYVGIPSNKAVA